MSTIWYRILGGAWIMGICSLCTNDLHMPTSNVPQNPNGRHINCDAWHWAWSWTSRWFSSTTSIDCLWNCVMSTCLSLALGFRNVPKAGISLFFSYLVHLQGPCRWEVHHLCHWWLNDLESWVYQCHYSCLVFTSHHGHPLRHPRHAWWPYLIQALMFCVLH